MCKMIKLYKMYILYSCFIIIETLFITSVFDSDILSAVFLIIMFIYVDIGGELYGRFSMGCRSMIDCDSDLSNKVNKSFENVKNRVELKFGCYPNIKLYYIPSEQINAFSFGRNSIGITTAAMNLDNHLIEAVLAHEIAHSIYGDMFLYRILVGNLVGAMFFIGLCNAILIGVIVFFAILLFTFTSLRYNFVTYQLSNVILNALQKLLSGIKYISFRIGEALIAWVSRHSEIKADKFAYILGYGRYLILFLEKYADSSVHIPHSLTEIIYSSHPDTYKRISILKKLN